ncbi:DUF4123 domain-containing protein [Archangium sp.]|uniref:DUF4123 domain-containing protein n=1 Tax=Archangium sp. TaxID=1872627 RepID=UPI002D2FED23|nr:DUF4123 domain-containing protein [Archangium sp.]HYO52169.1 DUF4123 domain-containing protein [Archangium sp.]
MSRETRLEGDGTVAPEQVLTVMRAEAEPLFAVLDAARERRMLKLLQGAGEPFESLYEGEEGKELAEVAPYLVSLPKDSALLEQLMRSGWGRSWGLFLTSRLPFKETRRHLRKFLMIEDASTGKQLYFRFYDPRVLRMFLPTCTAEQRTEFLGRLGSILAEGEKGEVLRVQGAEVSSARASRTTTTPAVLAAGSAMRRRLTSANPRAP